MMYIRKIIGKYCNRDLQLTASSYTNNGTASNFGCLCNNYPHNRVQMTDTIGTTSHTNTSQHPIVENINTAVRIILI